MGDNLHADVGGATPLGIRTVWITRRVPDPQGALTHYDGPPPTFTVSDLAEIEAFLEG